MSSETDEPAVSEKSKRREPPPESEEEKLLRGRSIRDFEWWNDAHSEATRRLVKFLWLSSVVLALAIGVAAVWVGFSIKPPPDYFPGHDRWSWIKGGLIIGGFLLPIVALAEGESQSRIRSLASRIIGYPRRLGQLNAEAERWYPRYDLDFMYDSKKVWYVPASQLSKADRETLEAIKPRGEQQGKYHKLNRQFYEETQLEEGELFVRENTYVMRVKSIGLDAVYVEVVEPITTSEEWEKRWKRLSKRQRTKLGE